MSRCGPECLGKPRGIFGKHVIFGNGDLQAEARQAERGFAAAVAEVGHLASAGITRRAAGHTDYPARAAQGWRPLWG